MSIKHPPTTAITLALCATLTACGGGGSSQNDMTDKQITKRVEVSSPNIEPVILPVSHYIQLTDARLPRKVTSPYSRRVHPLTKFEKEEIQKAFEFTNRLRAEAGMPPLIYDDNLASYAQVRAEESATFPDNLGHHKRPNGDSFSEGLKFSTGSIGENLLGGDQTAKRAVLIGWRNSPGHYANIISKNYRRIGIGFAYIPGSKYKHYWTQIFGSGDARTDYNFANGTNDTNIANTLAQKLLLGKNNTISLQAGSTTTTSATEAYKNGTYYKLNHPIYQSAIIYPTESYQLIAYNPQGSGLSYQTFAEITTKEGIPVQYANIGVPTIPNENIQLHATYEGASIGNFRQKDRVYATVTADIEYGLKQKSMKINFTNSMVAPNDIKNSSPQPLTQFSNVDFNFSRQLNWDQENHRFFNEDRENSEHIQAQFYGPNGEEIGGQFVHQIDQDSSHGSYEGVFAAKKQ